MIEVVLKIFTQRLQQMSPPERYRAVAAFFVGSPYEWGKENPTGADCSGLISGALMGAGYNIRVTAEDFLQNVFTTPSPYFDPTKIQAVFYVTEEDYDTPDGKRESGIARHVALIAGQDVVINANSYRNVIEYRTLSKLSEIFKKEKCYPLTRELNPAKALAYNGTLYGLDQELGGTDE